MLRIPAALAVVGLTALTLVGCSAMSPTASCERPVNDSTVLGLFDVSGDTGAPAVQVNSPVYVDHTVFADETVGEGTTVTSETQDVVFTVAIANGATGETILTSGTQVMPLSQWQTDYAGFATMMMCATEGSRIVGAIPSSDLSEAAASNLGLAEGTSAVVVMDLQKVYLAAADGAPQYNDRRGMPSVVLAPNGAPGIIVPGTPPPTDLAVEVLKKGAGPAVTADDSIRIHYTGVTWAGREVFDSTWDKGASTAVTLDGVVDGFAQALDGQTVGSQILVVIPPELGYGDQASGSIPASSTLVFVIDILGIDPPATS
ncbi:FKBP-type peptidyl-prolyl cis-trans isomerase [Microbacterium memoriense]|uniref:Peptidyl-prolyl cis-trans isomerase n=1 Tax=Microbacterium memoriense TaxID=2978350 RepID=A0ABT2P886_9MICO|nr:FKBP-type peptidyl-prolyl cis-trans isomerase [Microbacterium memoriense]MCT9000896.1 FKBP-type peptidyl-prolyl cis-trans isomerase [Microbacterium memoriense]